MNENTGPEATESDETTTPDVDTPETGSDAAESDSEPLEFPRRVVDELRTEAKNLRERTKIAETKTNDYAKRLHTELVRATGKLADPRDLPFSADHLDSEDALNGAIDELITERPHLKARQYPPVGQGVHGKATGPQDFSALFR